MALSRMNHRPVLAGERAAPRFLGVLGVLALLLVASRAGAQETQAIESAPRVVVEAAIQDFGRVARGTVVTRRFQIRNAGDAPLEIERMEFSTPGMRARVGATVAPGASSAVEIDWDTSHYTREAEGSVRLFLNDPATPRLVLTLTGFVVSPVDVEPVPAFYLSQFEGERARQTVTIRNNRDRVLRITGIEQPGEHFSVEVATVDPGRAYAVTATVRPDLPPGRYRDSVVVTTDAEERPRIRLDVNILVKQEVHASVDALDMGEVRIASVRANGSLLELLRQTVILESRATAMTIGRVSCDLPFITLQYEPQGPARRVRLDVGLDPGALRAGTYRGVVSVATGVESRPVVTLPVEVTVRD